MPAYWTFPGLERWGKRRFRAKNLSYKKRLCSILKEYGYPVHRMHEKRRAFEVVHMRRLYMVILHMEAGMTLKHIAGDLEMNHATVIHHNYKMRELMRYHNDFREEYRAIANRFTEGMPLKGLAEKALKNFKKG